MPDKFVNQTGLARILANVKANLIRTPAIPYGEVDSTSISTAFTATVPGITSLYDGVCMLLKNGVVTSASGFTIDINGLGAKPAYSNMHAATAETNLFNVNYTILFVYDSTRVSGGCWIYYRGYNSNDNTIAYYMRSAYIVRKAADKGARYRLWFRTMDGKYAPANLSTNTGANAARTPNPRVIDPFGEIIYCSTNAATEADAELAVGDCWKQYYLNFGYSFNTTGSALNMSFPLPVYLKCTPASGGGATMDGIVNALPSTADGKIYIYLGTTYSATNIFLDISHPVYEYKNGGIRLYTGAQDIEALTDAEVLEILEPSLTPRE